MEGVITFLEDAQHVLAIIEAMAMPLFMLVILFWHFRLFFKEIRPALDKRQIPVQFLWTLLVSVIYILAIMISTALLHIVSILLQRLIGVFEGPEKKLTFNLFCEEKWKIFAKSLRPNRAVF